MSNPATATPKEGRRLSALLGSQFDRPDTVASAATAYYAEVISMRIPRHRGLIVRSAGNIVLAEFEEATDAVNCAIDVQARLAQYNKLHLDNGMVEAKIGIHYGEILFEEGKFGGAGVDTTIALLSAVPVNEVYITRDILVKVLKFLPLKFESLGKMKIGSLPEPREILSVAWEAVTGNLEASLKKLGEDDLQRATRLSSKLGFGPSQRASPIVVVLVVVFLIALFKILKWF
jgi:hypothetical protein